MSPHSPPDLPVGELFRRLIETPRPFEVVDFPRVDPITKQPIGQVAIWPITQSEIMAAQAAADDYARNLMRTKPSDGEARGGFDAIYSNASSIEVLCKACRCVEDLKMPAFPSPKLARQTLTADECTVLTRLYLQVQRKVGPIVDLMTKEEMDAWLARLGEEGQRFPLSLLASAQLEELVMHSASLLRSYSTATTSSGSPPSDGSSEIPTDVEHDEQAPEDHDEPPPADLTP